jgi:hypothetical protein
LRHLLTVVLTLPMVASKFRVSRDRYRDDA